MVGFIIVHFLMKTVNKLLYGGKTGDEKIVGAIAVIQVRTDMTPVTVEVDKKLEQIAK